MINVENKGTLRMLTRRFLKINRTRNMIAVFSILLTSLLFTTLFTGSLSMILSKLEADKKTYVSWSHAILQDVSPEETDRICHVLSDTSSIEKFGCDMFLGLALDDRLNFQVEVRGGDKNALESFNCVPTTGSVPESADDIALSTYILDTLNLSHTLGTPVTLTFLINDKTEETFTKTFRLCGYWDNSDKLSPSQFAWISLESAQELMRSVSQKEIDSGLPNGTYSFSVWYKNIWNMEKKTRLLDELTGFADYGQRSRGFQINPAYEILFGSEGAAIRPSAILSIALLIMLAGYLIIYNVFHISVKNDIRTYGLLKNAGTTGKQLKHIVRLQALFLSAAGIPAGLALGYGAGLVLSPALSASLESSAPAAAIVSAHPLIFLASALFTLITVYLSCLHACNIVAKVSPVEALRLSQNEQTRRKVKPNSSVSWWGMALENIRRSFKKGCIVMLSVALSLVTLNGIVMLASGYDFDSYKDIYLSSDFEIDKLAPVKDFANFNGISEETRNILDTCPYCDSPGYIFFSEETHQMEPRLLNTWQQLVDRNKGWSSFWDERWEKYKASNEIPVLLLGINEAVFNKLVWYEGSCTWEDFSSGKYVITNVSPLFSDKEYNYKAGDMFTAAWSSGITRSYEVAAQANLPYSLDYPFTELISVEILVPETEFIRVTGNSSAMQAALDSLPGSEQQVSRYLRDSLLHEDSTFNIASVIDLRESFDRFINKYYMIGGCLAAVLAFIGIMNFFNTTATSILSRRKELALLEAVGMTKNQIRKMLAAEGCLYLAGALVLSVILTHFFAGRLLSRTLGTAFFFHIKTTVVPSLLMLPLLLAVAFWVPASQFKKISRESVVERIRQE